MKKRALRYRPKYRKTLDEMTWGPVIRLGICIAGILLLGTGIYFGISYIAEQAGKPGPLMKVERTPEPEPTPEPTPVVTATPEPPKVFKGKTEKVPLYALSGKTVLDADLSEQGITFVSGEDNSHPDTLYFYSFESNKLRALRVPGERGQLRNPARSEKCLVVEDISDSGAGLLRVLNLETMEWHTDAQIRGGAPAVSLRGSLCSFISRTGDMETSLFLIDVLNGIGTAVSVFDTAAYGAGTADLTENVLVYGDFLEDGTSGLVKIDLYTGVAKEYALDFVPHDPKAGDGFMVCLNAPHSEAAELMLIDERGECRQLRISPDTYEAEGGFVVYELDGSVFAYIPEDDVTFTLYEDAKIVCTGDGSVLVCSGEEYYLIGLEYGYGEG